MKKISKYCLLSQTKYYCFALILFLILHSEAIIGQNEQKMNHFEGAEEFVYERMKEWQVPGVAIGVIKNGEVILKRGFGFRDVEKKLPVTIDTQFGIGSCSKAFTGMAAGILVDDNKITWDTPIKSFISEFEMYNKNASEQASILDILYMETGMPGYTTLFKASSFTREDIFGKLKYLKPKAEFRERFVYSNIMYVMAGHILGKINQSSWEDLVTERILKPLHMNNTNFSINKMILSNDYATPYVKPFDNFSTGKRYAIEPVLRDISAPAGGINSSLDDMMKWLQYHINGKTIDGKQIVSTNTLNQIHSTRKDLLSHNETTTSGYGIGWRIEQYREKYKLVIHTGIIDGYCAAIAFEPNEKNGVVILTNMKFHSLHDVLCYYFIDKTLGLPILDYNGFFLNEWKKIDNNVKDTRSKLLARKIESGIKIPSLKNCVGEYNNPGYGNVVVKNNSKGLFVIINEKITMELEHLYDNVWMSTHPTLNYFDSKKIIFEPMETGKANSIIIPLQGDILFSRK